MKFVIHLIESIELFNSKLFSHFTRLLLLSNRHYLPVLNVLNLNICNSLLSLVVVFTFIVNRSLYSPKYSISMGT